MKWIEERERTSKRPNYVLTLEPAESLDLAWAELWKRILADSSGLPAASRWNLAIDIYARTFEADSTGQTTAIFNNSLNRQSEDIGTYAVRGEQFTLLQGKDEDDTAFGRRQLAWFLDQYKRLKTALGSDEVWPLYQRINGSHPLPVRLATINGWFDLQPGEPGFGALPYEDQELMAGMEPRKEDPMESLGWGVITLPRGSAIEELSEALIQYTPPHFKNIQCTIEEGVEEGQRALFYRIECPEFPDDGTTVANERVHRAATLLVQQMAPRQGAFSGLRIKLNMQSDGSWQRFVESTSR
jgi:hypothetical protein